MPTSSTPLIIGIAGSSGSGKTTIAQSILEAIGRDKIAFLPHDAYYRDQSEKTFEERLQVNYDHPDSLETELLIKHIQALKRGESVVSPPLSGGINLKAKEKAMSNTSLDNVQWRATLLLNFWRSVAAGIVWFIIRLIMQDSMGEAASMLLLPVVYFVILLPLGLLAIFLSNAGVPYVGFVSLVAAVAIIVGDPIVCLISLIKPGLLPVRNYSPLNFKLIMLVTY